MIRRGKEGRKQRENGRQGEVRREGMREKEVGVGGGWGGGEYSGRECSCIDLCSARLRALTTASESLGYSGFWL